MERQECLSWVLWVKLHAMEPAGLGMTSQDTADGHQRWTSSTSTPFTPIFLPLPPYSLEWLWVVSPKPLTSFPVVLPSLWWHVLTSPALWSAGALLAPGLCRVLGKKH